LLVVVLDIFIFCDLKLWLTLIWINLLIEVFQLICIWFQIYE